MFHTLKTVCFFLMALASAFPWLVDATTFMVGPSRTYTSPKVVAGLVNNGDTVLIDTGTYTNEYCTWSKSNLVLRGVSKYAHLIPPNPVPNQKAIWIISGQNAIIENIEFSDAIVTVSDGENGAGIRQEGANVTIRNCYFHDCQDGILAGANASSTITIEYSEFDRCGLNPCPSGGCVHNMYINAVAEFTLKGCYTHSAIGGHTVKSRALKNFILYNRISSEQSSTSYEIDLPNGGTSYIIGNVIEQGPNSPNSGIIEFGAEGLSNHDSSLYIVNNTIVNDKGSGIFVSISGTSKPARIVNNLFVGSGTLYSGPIDTSANLQTNSPAFVDRANFDYRPTSTTPGINKGVDPGIINSFNLTPVWQYIIDCSIGSRSIVGGTIDVGAFEYNAAPVKNHYSQKVVLPDLGPSLKQWTGTIDGRRLYGQSGKNRTIGSVIIENKKKKLTIGE